jgi:hypothetical protein
LSRHRAQRRCIGRAADHDGGRGIGDEIGEFGGGIGGVERHEHEPGAQRGEIQQHRLARFVDLHQHAVAGLRAQQDQPRRDPPGFAIKRVKPQSRQPVFDQQRFVPDRRCGVEDQGGQIAVGRVGGR